MPQGSTTASATIYDWSLGSHLNFITVVIAITAAIDMRIVRVPLGVSQTSMVERSSITG